MIISIFIILIILLVIVMNQQSQRTVVDVFVTAVEKNDLETIRELFQVEQREDLDMIFLKDFIRYLNENEAKLDIIEKSLQKQLDHGKVNPSAVVQLYQEKKLFNLLNKYELALKDSYLKIENIDEHLTNITLKNDMLLEQQEENLFGPIYPGIYQLIIQFENELGTFEHHEEVSIWDQSQYVIKVNQEAIMTEDKQLKLHLFEQSAVFSLRLIELIDVPDIDHDQYSVYRLLLTQNELPTDGVSYQFKQAVFDESAFNIMEIDDEWYANVRMIATFDQEEKEQVHLLFTISFLYHESSEEWSLFSYEWDETNESIYHIWDNTYELDREDLNIIFD